MRYLLVSTHGERFSSTSLNQALTSALAGTEGDRHLQAAQLFALAAQDPLDAVLPVGEPVRQVHVGQLEVRQRKRVRALRRETGQTCTFVAACIKQSPRVRA